MSMKIYNGLATELFSLLELNELKESFKAFKEDLKLDFTRHAVHSLIFLYDRMQYQKNNGLLKQEGSPFFITLDDIREDLSEAKKGKKASFDYSAEVSFYPLKDSSKWLIYLFCEKEKIIKKAKKIKNVKDYSYYSKENENKEWKQRKKDWEAACPSGTLGDGFLLSILSISELQFYLYDLFLDKKMLDKISFPSKKERLLELIKNIGLSVYLKENSLELDKDIDFSNLLSLLNSDEVVAFKKELEIKWKDMEFTKFTPENLASISKIEFKKS